MAEDGAVRVTVMYSLAPREVLEWAVTLEPGATVLQALQASGLPAVAPDLDLRHASVGLWGRRARLEERLRDRDRVEVLRPLKVDPKLARRERFRKQGSRAAGLFARRSTGTPDAKAGPG
jgi:putative ubiquitin-RnfH superfamily antitoxin RatB of RatAB toxin-antitoxin module